MRRSEAAPAPALKLLGLSRLGTDPPYVLSTVFCRNLDGPKGLDKENVPGTGIESGHPLRSAGF